MPIGHPPGLPARAKLDAAGLHVALADIAPGELRDPFLQETVQRLQPALTLAQVPKDELGRAPAPTPAFTAPAGLIFHVARCGSTLASQLLKLDDGPVVYSEPLAINELLVPPQAGSRADLVAALRTLGGFFAAHAQRPYVLKLTSWNTLFADIVAEAFPQVPWALCVRDPLVVCVSLQQRRPGWLRDDNAALFAGFVDSTERDAERRVARVYAAFCEAAGRLDPARGLLLPYEALPGAVWGNLAPHFGLRLADASKLHMAAAAQCYSKSPVGQVTAFVPDDEQKRNAASPELRRAVDELARPAYRRLIDQLRSAG